MKVRFPMYFECVAYQEIDLPDYIDPDNEQAVKDYVESEWWDIPLPDENKWEFVDGTCEFDPEGIYSVIKR